MATAATARTGGPPGMAQMTSAEPQTNWLMLSFSVPSDSRKREGVDLSQVLDSESPLGTPPRSFNMLVLAHGSLPDTELASKENELSYFEEHAEHTYHVGTHLDGLGHVGIAGRFYNGHAYGDIYTPMGLKKLGAEKNIPPFITRGVLLDIAGLVGDEVLPTGFQIGVDLLESAAKRQEVELRPDAVLLHTGWADRGRATPRRTRPASPASSSKQQSG